VKSVYRVYSCSCEHISSSGASPAIWDYTVLPATRHRRTRPALASARQAAIYLPWRDERL